MADSATKERLLSISSLQEVLKEIHAARSQWEFIGLELGVSKDDLDALKREHGLNPQKCLTELLSKWLRQFEPTPTWASLIRALRSDVVGYKDLSEKLKKKYLPLENAQVNAETVPPTINASCGSDQTPSTPSWKYKLLYFFAVLVGISAIICYWQNPREQSVPIRLALVDSPTLPLNLVWREKLDLPYKFARYRPMYAVEGGEKIFIVEFEKPNNNVLVYHTGNGSVTTLPHYLYEQYAITVIDNNLVVVGGVDRKTGKRTNQLGLWNETSQKWTHPFPPMKERSSLSTVVTYNESYLVVVGGTGNKRYLSRVEILDIHESKWYRAAPHHDRQIEPSSSVLVAGNVWCLMGGYTKSVNSWSNRVFCVCLDELINQAVHQSHGQVQSGSSPWYTLPDTPYTVLGAFSVGGALLTIGEGSIYFYKPSTRTWEYVPEDIISHSDDVCIYLRLSNSEIFTACGDLAMA